MNNLIDDVLLYIMSELNCLTISSLSCTCQFMHQLINKHDCFNKRKYKGFPRHQTQYHNLTQFFNINTKLFDVDTNYTTSLLKNVTLFIHQNNIDIVRGDIINLCHYVIGTNFGHYIYDGVQVIDLDDESVPELPDKILPSSFTFNEVLKDYWENALNGYFMWLDLTTIKEQCLSNIIQLQTHFTLKNQTYKIIYDSIDDYAIHSQLESKSDDWHNQQLLKLLTKNILLTYYNNFIFTIPVFLSYYKTFLDL